MKFKFAIITLSSLAMLSCVSNSSNVNLVEENITYMTGHHKRQVSLIENSGETLNPRTIDKQGNIEYIPIDDWTSGFFPGSMWYTYELTKDAQWLPLAIKYTEALDSVKYLKWHHDVGFMIGSSFLNGYRIGKKEEYKDVVIEAARSLSTRYRPVAGVIQSWDSDRGWQGTRGWDCPVIIDNMMNLELLFEATKMSGDSTFYNVAVNHANTTMAHHFREDNSCYHVIDYSMQDGSVRHKHTAQGYAHESSWARGQAWALYGYVTCYRYTENPAYLAQAEKVYNFIFNNENLPEDKIPYWDFDAPNIPSEPRDVSAAACTASALYELCTYVPGKGYKEMADLIVKNLSTPAYRAGIGTNGNFILMHSVGSIPHGAEIDVPLNYADYYFQECLIRKRNLEQL